ncbi:MAG: hypothetical protein ACYTGH_13010 [Planctomycetota bacterium]|jgi:hypothetical protein
MRARCTCGNRNLDMGRCADGSRMLRCRSCDRVWAITRTRRNPLSPQQLKAYADRRLAELAQFLESQSPSSSTRPEPSST